MKTLLVAEKRRRHLDAAVRFDSVESLLVANASVPQRFFEPQAGFDSSSVTSCVIALFYEFVAIGSRG